jgi:hypothetical protein
MLLLNPPLVCSTLRPAQEVWVLHRAWFATVKQRSSATVFKSFWLALPTRTVNNRHKVAVKNLSEVPEKPIRFFRLCATVKQRSSATVFKSFWLALPTRTVKHRLHFLRISNQPTFLRRVFIKYQTI